MYRDVGYEKTLLPVRVGPSLTRRVVNSRPLGASFPSEARRPHPGRHRVLLACRSRGFHPELRMQTPPEPFGLVPSDETIRSHARASGDAGELFPQNRHRFALAFFDELASLVGFGFCGVQIICHLQDRWHDAVSIRF